MNLGENEHAFISIILGFLSVEQWDDRYFKLIKDYRGGFS